AAALTGDVTAHGAAHQPDVRGHVQTAADSAGEIAADGGVGQCRCLDGPEAAAVLLRGVAADHAAVEIRRGGTDAAAVAYRGVGTEHAVGQIGARGIDAAAEFGVVANDVAAVEIHLKGDNTTTVPGAVAQDHAAIADVKYASLAERVAQDFEAAAPARGDIAA